MVLCGVWVRFEDLEAEAGADMYREWVEAEAEGRVVEAEVEGCKEDGESDVTTLSSKSAVEISAGES